MRLEPQSTLTSTSLRTSSVFCYIGNKQLPQASDITADGCTLEFVESLVGLIQTLKATSCIYMRS